MGRRGITFDTGALIALERRGRRMTAVLKAAHEDDLLITVPAAVLVEWWRGQPKNVASVLDAVRVELLTDRLARIAGLALSSCPGSVGAIDAIVMASAAQRGDHVYTSDLNDLQALQGAFPDVRLFGAH